MDRQKTQDVPEMPKTNAKELLEQYSLQVAQVSRHDDETTQAAKRHRQAKLCQFLIGLYCVLDPPSPL